LNYAAPQPGAPIQHKHNACLSMKRPTSFQNTNPRKPQNRPLHRLENPNMPDQPQIRAAMYLVHLLHNAIQQ
jgi:hypothetical protein